MTGSPFDNDATTPLASLLQQVTVTNSRSPSTHSPLALSNRRSLLATRKLTTRTSSAVRRDFGSVSTLPTIVTDVSFIAVSTFAGPYRITSGYFQPVRWTERRPAVGRQLWTTGL